MPTASQENHAYGTLLGQCIGDSLGAQVEFSSAESIRSRFPDGVREMTGGGPHRILPGQVTDDSELALALARSIVKEGQFDVEAVARAYAAWKDSGPFDCGMTCGGAFGGWPRNSDEPIALRMLHRASKRTSSEANGSLMRISPLAIYGWRAQSDELSRMAQIDSALSHASEMCRQCCDVFTFAIALAIREPIRGREVVKESLGYAYSKGYTRVYDLLLDSAVSQSSNAGVDGGTQGWVVHGFQAAFHHLVSNSSFEEAIVETINMGGDTDSNSAIVGALVGSVCGASGIPERWKKTVILCQSPRPSTYHTHDLDELARRLLEIGEEVPTTKGRR